jgi:hypothetical protein
MTIALAAASTTRWHTSSVRVPALVFITFSFDCHALDVGFFHPVPSAALGPIQGGVGGQEKLSGEQQAALYEALQGEPDDGGLWPGPKVARYVAGRWGVEVCPQTAWRWLRGLGFRLLVPRPRNPGAAAAEQRRRWL